MLFNKHVQRAEWNNKTLYYIVYPKYNYNTLKQEVYIKYKHAVNIFTLDLEILLESQNLLE